jgi:hypothetical protein
LKSEVEHDGIGGFRVPVELEEGGGGILR